VTNISPHTLSYRKQRILTVKNVVIRI